LEGSSSRDEASRKTTTGREPDQSAVGKRRTHSGNVRDSPRHGGE